MVPTALRGLENRKAVPQSTSQNWLGEKQLSAQTLDGAIDFGFGDHMGDFDESGFTVVVGTKGRFEWVQKRMGRKAVETPLYEEVPVKRRATRVWLGVGAGSRGFLKEGNVTACSHARPWGGSGAGKRTEQAQEQVLSRWEGMGSFAWGGRTGLQGNGVKLMGADVGRLVDWGGRT